MGIGENLKNAGKELANGTIQAARIGTIALDEGTKLGMTVTKTTLGTTTKVINTAGHVAGKGLDITKSVADTAEIVTSSGLKSGASIFKSTAEATNKIYGQVTESGVQVTTNTLKSGSKIYSTTINQGAKLASSSIEASTEGISQLFQVAAEKQRSLGEAKVSALIETRNLNIQKKIRKDYEEKLQNFLVEISLGIITSINTYLKSLSFLRHLIFEQRKIAHIWRTNGNSGFPKFSFSFKKRTNNANLIEINIRTEWEKAKNLKKLYLNDLKLAQTETIASFNEIFINRNIKNTQYVLEKIFKQIDKNYAQIMSKVKKDYDQKIKYFRKIAGYNNNNNNNNNGNQVRKLFNNKSNNNKPNNNKSNNNKSNQLNIIK